jgi:hypothetical protein
MFSDMSNYKEKEFEDDESMDDLDEEATKHLGLSPSR